MDIHTFLQFLSGTAIITTIALFFCGIPICIEIARRKSTVDISGMPFLMGFLGGSFWLRYGFLKSDYTMITVNVVGVTFFCLYCFFYLTYAKPKCMFAAKLAGVFSLIAAMLVWAEMSPNLDVLGVACMTFNIINFGAPLAGLGVVLRKRCCDSLPLPMCVANLLVSSQWFLYGNIISDSYVMIPNGIGMALAVLQLSLFVIFPMKSTDQSIIQKLFGCSVACCPCCPPCDIESGECESNRTASTNASGSGTLYRKPSYNGREKRRSGSFLEVATIHPSQPIRPRTNSMPEALKYKFK